MDFIWQIDPAAVVVVAGSLLITVAFFVLREPGVQRAILAHLPRRRVPNIDPAPASRPVDPARMPSERHPSHAAPAPHPDAPPILHDWLTILNDHADAHPHLLVAGKSGSGKTTLARAVLTRRTGSVCVINPKDDPEDWHPLPYITVDNDGTFTSLAQALESLYRELIQRERNAEPLTIILDDVSLIAQSPETKDAYRRFMRAAARTGRSKRLRLLVLAQETTAAAIGLPGEAALLENFTRVDVQRHTHRATLTHSDDTYELDTQQVPRIARHPLNLFVWKVSHPEHDDTGFRTIEPVPTTGGGLEIPTRTGSSEPIHTGSIDTDGLSDDTLIYELVRRGVSANKIADLLGGTRAHRLEQVRLARATLQSGN